MKLVGKIKRLRIDSNYGFISAEEKGCFDDYYFHFDDVLNLKYIDIGRTVTFKVYKSKDLLDKANTRAKYVKVDVEDGMKPNSFIEALKTISLTGIVCEVNENGHGYILTNDKKYFFHNYDVIDRKHNELIKVGDNVTFYCFVSKNESDRTNTRANDVKIQKQEIKSMVKLTPQEQKVTDYLKGKKTCAYEELAQFCSEPQKVKLSTIKRIISGITKKFSDAKDSCPFVCQFVPLETKQVEQIAFVKLEQQPQPQQEKQVEKKNNYFVLDKLFKCVFLKRGPVNLSDNEWELMKHFDANKGNIVSMEDLKNVVYHNFGSKTPHHWKDSIARTITKLRKNLPELKTENKLVTVMIDGQASYMYR